MTIWNYDVRDFFICSQNHYLQPRRPFVQKVYPKTRFGAHTWRLYFFEMIISRRLDFSGLSGSHSHRIRSSGAYKMVFICSSATLKSVQTDRNARATRDSTEERMVNASRKSCATRSRHLNECWMKADSTTRLVVDKLLPYVRLSNKHMCIYYFDIQWRSKV